MIPRLRKPSRRAREWHKKNTWFGVNIPLTEATLHIHEALLFSKIKPDSAEYYKAMDAQIKQLKLLFGEDKE